MKLITHASAGNQSDLASIKPTRNYTLEHRGFVVKLAVQLRLRRSDMQPAVVQGIAPYDTTGGLGPDTIVGPGIAGHTFPGGYGVPPVIDLRENLTAQQSNNWTGLLNNIKVDQMAERLAQRVQDAIDTYLDKDGSSSSPTEDTPSGGPQPRGPGQTSTRGGPKRTQARLVQGSDVQLTGGVPTETGDGVGAPAASSGGGGMGIALLAAAGIGAAFFLTRGRR